MTEYSRSGGRSGRRGGASRISAVCRHPRCRWTEEPTERSGKGKGGEAAKGEGGWKGVGRAVPPASCAPLFCSGVTRHRHPWAHWAVV